VLVEKGETLLIGVAALDDRLSFAVDTAATLAGAAHAETTLLSSVTNKSAAKPEGPLPFEVGEMDMCRLNDPSWSAAYRTGMLASIAQHGCNSILCVCDRTSMSAIAAAKAGAQKVAVVTMGMPASHAQAIRTSAQNSGVESQVRVCEMGLAQFAEVTCGGRQKMGGWDMLVMDVVEGGGELRQEVMADFGLAWATLLNPGARVIPASATVMVQPIHCPYILRQNSVITEAVLGVDLTTLDAWRVGTFREVDLRSSGVPHEVLGEARPGLKLSFDTPAGMRMQASEVCASVPGLRGLATERSRCTSPNEMQGCHATNKIQIKCIRGGTISCLAYWFELDLGMGQVINTGPQGGVMAAGHGLRKRMPPHWRQAVAILPNNGISVQAGDTLSLTVSCLGSSICFTDVDVTS